MYSDKTTEIIHPHYCQFGNVDWPTDALQQSMNGESEILIGLQPKHYIIFI